MEDQQPQQDCQEEQNTNDNQNDNNTKPQTQEINDPTKLPETKGWLLKKRKISNTWEKKWFVLKNTDLHYGKAEGVLSKKISLVGAEIAESNIENKQHTFRLKPKDSKRTFYLQAMTEQSQHDWMQAICFAKATGRTDKSEACILQ